MRRFLAVLSILSLIFAASLPNAVFAKQKKGTAITAVAKAKKKVKAPPVFGAKDVKKLVAEIAEVNAAENFLMIREGKGKNKKVLFSGAVLVQITQNGVRVVTAAELVAKAKADFYVKKEKAAKKEYQALLVLQIIAAPNGSPAPAAPSGLTAQFAAASSQGVENITAPTSVRIALSSAAMQEVRVAYTVAGTATGSGTDYTLANGELVIPVGQIGGNIPLAVVDDSAPESDETVVVTLTSATNATLGAAVVHTYTIQDNDTHRVHFSAASSSGAESATPVSIQVALMSGTSTQAVLVDYAVTGTAGSGTDYTLAAGTLTIAPGQTNGALSLIVIDDQATESAETVVVTLSNPRGATLGTNAIYTYTIQDNDQNSVGFTVGSSTAAESAGLVNLTVNVVGTTTDAVQVNYAVTGTATSGGTDFSLSNGTLVIPAGQTSGTIGVTLVDDALDELDETVIVTLSSPSGASLGATSAHTLTIQDNDVPTVQFSAATASGGENAGAVNIAVAVSPNPAVQVQVYYTLTGTASGGGTDYTLANGTLSIPAGQASANIVLAVVDDAVADPNETVVVTLSNPTNATLGANTTHTYTITDND